MSFHYCLHAYVYNVNCVHVNIVNAEKWLGCLESRTLSSVDRRISRWRTVTGNTFDKWHGCKLQRLMLHFQLYVGLRPNSWLRWSLCLGRLPKFKMGPKTGIAFVSVYGGRIWTILHCVSENVPTFARCTFDKHGLILIIVGEQHQNMVKTVWVFNFLCPFSFTYFIFF